MKIVLPLLLFTINALACTEYEIKGRLISDPTAKFGAKVVIFEKTRSEIRLDLAIGDDFSRLKSFFGQTLHFKAYIPKALDGTKGVLTKPYNIQVVAPNPMAMEGNFKKVGPCRR
ncbi:MAG: hypothetical protein HN353_04220 [Bdellovibrionales bacterium]|nr:hypothetical protein [Bdellovibrionales bacterium]MBT3526511.1 hypothetical protein [Bdellovibrionales bacterium]MBT7668922.1 hypothetical protein [Bdellovibrionales bacterium]MBT7766397.1 hypothetical protein [Bdellovibrionales bacterium]